MIFLYSKYTQPVPDDIDREIAERKLKAWDADPDPRVGDFIIMPDGAGKLRYHRFAYRWPERMQTCESGSFYLGDGYASMSGALDPSIPKDEIKRTDEIRHGHFWFFHHDYMTAHNGVGVQLPCRVYKWVPGSDA